MLPLILRGNLFFGFLDPCPLELWLLCAAPSALSPGSADPSLSSVSSPMEGVPVQPSSSSSPPCSSGAAAPLPVGLRPLLPPTDEQQEEDEDGGCVAAWGSRREDAQGGLDSTRGGADRGDRASSSSRDVASDWGAHEQSVSSLPAAAELCGAPCSSLWKCRTNLSVKRRQKAAAESRE